MDGQGIAVPPVGVLPAGEAGHIGEEHRGPVLPDVRLAGPEVLGAAGPPDFLELGAQSLRGDGSVPLVMV